MKKQTRQLVTRALKLQEKLDKTKALYKELDHVVFQLAREGFTGADIGNVHVDLVDQFEDVNTCFKATGVKRFVLKVKAKV